MATVLVTGAAGYIGSNLVPKLLDLGHKVICVDNLMYEPTSLLEPAKNPNCQLIIGDSRDKTLMEPLINKSDVIIPLACLTGAPLCDRNKSAAVNTNRDSIVLCSELSSQSQLIIYPCTNSGYGVGQEGIYCDENTELKPISLYGKTKVEAEKILLDKGTKVRLRWK